MDAMRLCSCSLREATLNTEGVEVIKSVEDKIKTYEDEINNFISNQMTLREAGVLRVSQITLKLEEFEFELQKTFDKSLEQYIDMANRYTGYHGGIIDLMKECAQIELRRLNKLKALKKKWHDWMNDMFDYV